MIGLVNMAGGGEAGVPTAERKQRKSVLESKENYK